MTKSELTQWCVDNIEAWPTMFTTVVSLVDLPEGVKYHKLPSNYEACVSIRQTVDRVTITKRDWILAKKNRR